MSSKSRAYLDEILVGWDLSQRVEFLREELQFSFVFLVLFTLERNS